MSAPDLTLKLFEDFGAMTEREQKIATAAAGQGWAGRNELVKAELPEALLAFVKNLDSKTVAKFAPDLFTQIMRKGWDLAIEKKAAGTKGVTGMLSMQEVQKLAEALKGPDVKVDFPKLPAVNVTVNNQDDEANELFGELEDGCGYTYDASAKALHKVWQAPQQRK